MVTGPAKSAGNDAALLFHTLGKNLPFVERYLRQARDIALVAGGGSDRQFFRLTRSADSLMLMVSPKDDQEFLNYLAIATFLYFLGVGAPEIYEAHPEAHLLIMEDVGDTSLYRLLRHEQSKETIVAWYKKVLDLLAYLQVEGRNQWGTCPQATRRTFDYAALRWEADYFCTSFVGRYCTINTSGYAGLDDEFDSLARRISAEPLFFMHRDFQSQNIMIHENRLRVIDFQGARKGLLQYDLASLLKDSYLVLSQPLQQELLAYYCESLCKRGVPVLSQDQFCEIYTLAGLQRNMQALGAFAFLSREKGKTWFEKFIPAGLQHLKAALKSREEFPALGALVENIAELLSNR